jgi:hypothetical protein
MLDLSGACRDRLGKPTATERGRVEGAGAVWRGAKVEVTPL